MKFTYGVHTTHTQHRHTHITHTPNTHTSHIPHTSNTHTKHIRTHTHTSIHVHSKVSKWKKVKVRRQCLDGEGVLEDSLLTLQGKKPRMGRRNIVGGGVEGREKKDREWMTMTVFCVSSTEWLIQEPSFLMLSKRRKANIFHIQNSTLLNKALGQMAGQPLLLLPLEPNKCGAGTGSGFSSFRQSQNCERFELDRHITPHWILLTEFWLQTLCLCPCI